MTPQSSPAPFQLDAIRKAFDDAFAAPPPQPPRDAADFLVIGVGGAPYAIRLADLIGLEANCQIVPMPTDRAALLGLCAVRGQLVPVFDLGQVMGLRQVAPPRWVALHRSSGLVGLAFEALEGSQRVPLEDVHALEVPPAQARWARETIVIGSRLIQVVDIPLVVSHLRREAHPR